MRKLTLTTDSEARKAIPLRGGCYAYFPAALMGVAIHSKMGNDKHNPGEPLHHARGKSMDHAECIERHLMDLEDMTARKVIFTDAERDAVLAEANALSWRVLALSQELHEKFGAPLAPAAKVTTQNMIESLNKAIGNESAAALSTYGQKVANSPVKIGATYAGVAVNNGCAAQGKAPANQGAACAVAPVGAAGTLTPAEPPFNHPFRNCCPTRMFSDHTDGCKTRNIDI